MTVSADQPGVQFYTGNFMDGTTKGKGVNHVQYAALCLEIAEDPQLHQRARVEATRSCSSPGQTYRHTMIHKFTTE